MTLHRKRAGSPRRGTRWTMTLLAAAAFVLSAVLTWQQLSAVEALPGCGVGSACEEVAQSRWARLGPVPVALPGSLIYLAIFLLSLLLDPEETEQQRARIWALLLPLGLLTGGAALWFVGLQMFVLHKACDYCLLIHLCGLILSAILLAAAPIWKFRIKQGLSLTLPWGRWPLGVAFVGFALFMIGQIVIRPRRHVVTPAAHLQIPNNVTVIRPATGPATVSTDPPPAIGSVPATPPVPQFRGRPVSLLEGRLRLGLEEHPFLGPRTAPHVIMALVDYTCPNCRRLHGQLRQALDRYPGQLAVILLHVPLASSCNPLVAQTEVRHVNSCVYARYALAVWYQDPDKFPEYDDWLSQGETPPPTFEARARAEVLVGTQSLQDLLAGAAVDEGVRDGVKVFQYLGAGTVPKLVLSNAVVAGEFRSAEELFSVLEKEEGLVAPVSGGD